MISSMGEEIVRSPSKDEVTLVEDSNAEFIFLGSSDQGPSDVQDLGRTCQVKEVRPAKVILVKEKDHEVYIVPENKSIEPTIPEVECEVMSGYVSKP